MNASSSKKIEFVAPDVSIMAGIPMSAAEFSFFKELISDTAGINLNDQKLTLVQSRLGKRMRELGFGSYRDYVKLLKSADGEVELTNFINALTTNKTEFFREQSHFEFLKNFWQKEFKHRHCYIWSAACSIGSEVYTLGILGEEFRRDHPAFDYNILGSDIDSNMLAKSSAGIYQKNEIVGLPPLYLTQYFYRGNGQNAGSYRVNDVIRNKVKIRQFNLIDDSDTLDFHFDVIFLRNVLIYFARETVESVINKMWKHLKPGGLLFIGHSENLHGLTHKFASIGASIYQAKK